MNPADHSKTNNGRNGHAGLTQDDVYFTLFRHKWLILAFTCLGILGAIGVRVLRPPPYMSQLKLMIPFVKDTRRTQAPGEESQIHATDMGAQSTIAAEVDILTSLDVAKRAAAAVGPARILASKGGGNDLLSAAGVICRGLTVDPPKTTVITVAFKNPDKSIVQPVLSSILTNYQQKHVEVYQGDHASEEYLARQLEEIRKKLAQTDEDLRAAKREANVPFPEEDQRSMQTEVAKTRAELYAAERELETRSAILGEAEKRLANDTNAAATLPANDKIEEYNHLLSSLQVAKKRKFECEDQGYRESHPIMAGVLERIQKLTMQKEAMEKEFPSLIVLAAAAARGGTNNPSADLMDIKTLDAKVQALRRFLAKLEGDAGRMMENQPKIAKLLSQRDEQQKTYNFTAKRLDDIRAANQASPSLASDTTVVDPPSPPRIDYKKFTKLIGIALGGCIALGFALAFLIDLVLDRSIRRPTDVEKHLHMPVFLTIPDTEWSGGFRWPWQRWLAARKNGHSDGNGDGDVEVETETAIAPWKPENSIQSYTEGLRERLLTYFEVNNLNLKKPKLVAVTGCGSGSGVSTLASGLAAALSKTGDGNVLLVNMNSQDGIAHAFHRGKPGCGLTDVLEPSNRAEAQLQDKLYLARIDHNQKDNVALVMPSRFNKLVPKLKASDYDYIVFDMPAISPTSITPRMSSHMDIVLMVLESEKTGQHRAAKASALMRESRANVAAVLNKCRQHVPEALSQEL